MKLNQLWFKIKEFKKAKESNKIPPVLLILLFVAVVVVALSSFPIRNVNATYTQNGDFQIVLTVERNYYYTDETVKIGMRLQNLSKQIQLVKFSGGCQATYQIYTLDDELVFPRYAEETPCNNNGYEEFLIAPNQAKNYYFEINGAILPEGKYKVVGLFQGFGNTESILLDISKRPDLRANEGELCSGLTGLSCKAGLSCKHEGGFTDGAGICMGENSFEPKNSCNNGVDNCFKDTKNHYAEKVIEKFIQKNRVSGFDDNYFRPDDYITVSDFTKLVSSINNEMVVIETTDPFVQRDTAIAVLYQSFISKSEPKVLDGYPFQDIGNSQYRNYISKAYNMGLLNSADYFFPKNYLTRADALILIDRFEN